MRILFRKLSGQDVKRWQEFLIAHHLLPVEGADGIFGAQTLNATLEFQRQHGLEVDGVVGKHTLAAALAHGFVEPVRNFYLDVISQDHRFRSTRVVSDVQMLEPIMRGKVTAIIQEAREHGVNFMVFETYRSQARQAQLFKEGASKLQKVGTHHYGIACDIVRSVNGQPSWKGDFSLLGQLAKKHGLIWGGNWTGFVDAVHVQRCALGRQELLFAGSWYPDDVYNPLND